MSSPCDPSVRVEPVPASEALDRRGFLKAGGAAAALLAAPMLAAPIPAGATAVAQRLAPDVSRAGMGSGDGSYADPDAWHVDDVWGHRPRYAHPIPYGAHPGSPVSWEHVDPIDLQFVG